MIIILAKIILAAYLGYESSKLPQRWLYDLGFGLEGVRFRSAASLVQAKWYGNAIPGNSVFATLQRWGMAMPGYIRAIFAVIPAYAVLTANI